MRSRFVIPAALLMAVAYVKGRRDARAADPAWPPAEEEPGEVAAAAAEAAATLAAPRGSARAAGDGREGMTGEEAAILAEWSAAPARPRGPAPEPAHELLAEWTATPAPAALRPPAPDPGPALEVLAEWTATPAQRAAAPSPPPAAGAAADHDPPLELLPEWVAQAAGPGVPAAPVVEEGRFAVGGWAAAAGHTAVGAVTYRHRRPGAGEVRLILEAADNVPAGGAVVLQDTGFAPDAEGFALIVAAAGPGAFAAAGRYELRAA